MIVAADKGHGKTEVKKLESEVGREDFGSE